jgi:catechol 2,3-dioxygenase-like lactoylglutathione lyase family enzyme
MPFPPITHIALTVSDLDRSAAWYSRLFDAEPVLRTVLLKKTPNEYSVAVWAEPNFAVHHFPDGGRERADARNPGLDHVAFGCETLEELERWAARLDELGVERGEVLTDFYGWGLAFWDPDGNPLELFTPKRPRPRTGT